jgi:predicted N-acetyltransferase YhbS
MEKLYYGRGKDADNAALIKFLDEVFFTDDPDKREFLEILPKIYKDQYRPAYNNFVTQENNGEFRAAIGNFCNYLSIGSEDVFACCIGNVAVGKKFRSKGYMIELMNMSIDDMKKREVDMAYLGGQRQRYGYFGFETSGVRYEYSFNRQTIKHTLGNKSSGLKVFELESEDYQSLENIESIYAKNIIKAQRTMDRYYDILCSWRSTPYILVDNGNFIGYFVLSHDGSGVLECGTVSPEYFGRMVLAIFETSQQYSIEFPTAPFETEKIKFFDENSEGMTIGGCESILVLNYEKVLRAFMNAKASYSKLCDGEITVLIHGKRQDEKLKISVKNNEPEVMAFDGEAEYEFSHFEATRVFFSTLPSGREMLKPEIQQWLPLPAFMFGTDTM